MQKIGQDTNQNILMGVNFELVRRHMALRSLVGGGSAVNKFGQLTSELRNVCCYFLPLAKRVTE